jgi:hypothetical protein
MSSTPQVVHECESPDNAIQYTCSDSAALHLHHQQASGDQEEVAAAKGSDKRGEKMN